jgi:hypothetical protein
MEVGTAAIEVLIDELVEKQLRIVKHMRANPDMEPGYRKGLFDLIAHLESREYALRNERWSIRRQARENMP